MKKHTRQITSGVILFILGGIIIPTAFGITIVVHVLKEKPLAQFVVPGQATVTIEKPGRYYLWNDYQTTFEGTTYSTSTDFPGGLDISLLENQTGKKRSFKTNVSISSSTPDSAKNSIGYFEVDQPATYILSVFGNTQPRVCSFGTSIFNLKNVLAFLICSVFSIVIAIIGVVRVIVGLANLTKTKKQISQPACQPLTPPASDFQ